MRTVEGRGGTVFAVGDPYAFRNIPLHDVGDGWDYVAPDGLGCWIRETLVFEVQDDDGDWSRVEPVEVYERTGRVGFGRCYRDQWVRVSGVCHPTAFVGWGSSWRLMVNAAAAAAPVLSTDTHYTQLKLNGVHAIVDGVLSPPINRVFTLLPFGAGVYAGFGELTATVGGVAIDFDNEGVLYEPRSNN